MLTHQYESYHTQKYVKLTYKYELCHTLTKQYHRYESCHILECVMLHVGMSQNTNRNASCYTSTWVVSRIDISNITHGYQSCHIQRYTSTWIVSPLDISNITHRYQSCHAQRYTSTWVVSHIDISDTTHSYESCHVQECYDKAMQVWMSHVTHRYESCHTRECVTSHIGASLCIAQSHFRHRR